MQLQLKIEARKIGDRGHVISLEGLIPRPLYQSHSNNYVYICHTSERQLTEIEIQEFLNNLYDSSQPIDWTNILIEYLSFDEYKSLIIGKNKKQYKLWVTVKSGLAESEKLLHHLYGKTMERDSE